ncbi:MAG: adenosylcobinamide-GDP ribazoletransferase [Alphaproteobacteria bacterium GM202ARS2]|nr:adenosylcobinamide-GDP ribazoletransferase [Alphaproteobacteria bacterium GM202ARS2]
MTTQPPSSSDKTSSSASSTASPSTRKRDIDMHELKSHVLPWYLDFLASLRLLTRLPLAEDNEAIKDDKAIQKRLQRATRSFPFTGIVVGGIGAATLIGSAYVALPYGVACVLALTLMIIATGALHEDGLCDVADSLGGTTPEERHAIMKDSRIGTYGTLALMLALLAKFAALYEVGNSAYAAQMLIASACASRAAMVALPCFLAPIPIESTHPRQSLSQQLGQLSPAQLIVPTTLAALLVLLFLARLDTALTVLATSAVLTFLMIRFATKTYRGYNGDLCGACQQINEVGVLIITSTLFHSLS